MSAEVRSSSWSESEIKALLAAWSEESIQDELEGAKRNKSVYQDISRKLGTENVFRDWKQCRAKIKNLKTSYKSAKDKNNKSGSNRHTCKFFDRLDAILGPRSSTHPPQVLETSESGLGGSRAVDTVADSGSEEEQADDPPDTEPANIEGPSTSETPSSKKRTPSKLEAMEKVMESQMKKFCVYQKESQDKFMEWEERKLGMLLENEKKREDDMKQHQLQLIAMLGSLIRKDSSN